MSVLTKKSKTKPVKTQAKAKPVQKEEEIEVTEEMLEQRFLRRSPRQVLFAARVTPEFNKRIRTLAYQNQVQLVEMLERYEQAYLEKLAKEGKKVPEINKKSK